MQIFRLFRGFAKSYIPSSYPQIFAQHSRLCAKLFHTECNDAHKCLLLSHTSYTKKKKNCRSNIRQKNMNRTIGMLCKHLQKLVQYSQVWRELSSCNTCEQDRKTTVHIFKTHIIFTQSPTKLPQTLLLHETIYPLSKSPLGVPVFAQWPLLWRWTCAETTTLPQQWTKRGGEFFVFGLFFVFLTTTYLFVLAYTTVIADIFE